MLSLNYIKPFFRKGMRRLIIAFFLLFGNLAIGFFGFIVIEGFSAIDAFYMTVITFSTVGFTEVQPLSPVGRVFTGFYIIVNLGIFAYVVSVISSYLFEGELNQIFRIYRAGQEVLKMKNHVIVCGFGRNGMKACEELKQSGEQFVLLERDDEILAYVDDNFGYQVIKGDATHDEILKTAGIDRAKSIITTLPNDADNVFISLSAKELNPDVMVIARASEVTSEKKLFRAGADKVVMPDALGGQQMAQFITKPYVIEYLEMLTGTAAGHKLKLEEFPCDDLSSDFKEKSLRDLDIRRKTGVTLVGFKDDQQGFLFNPSPRTIMGSNDVMIILGTDENLRNFRKMFLKRHHH